MNQFVFGIVVHYVLTSIANFGTTFNWGQLTATINTDISKYVPAWLRGTATDLAAGAIQVVQLALEDTADLQLIATKLNSGDYAGALVALEQSVSKVVHQAAAGTLAAVATIKAPFTAKP